MQFCYKTANLELVLIGTQLVLHFTVLNCTLLGLYCSVLCALNFTVHLLFCNPQLMQFSVRATFGLNRYWTLHFMCCTALYCTLPRLNCTVLYPSYIVLYCIVHYPQLLYNEVLCKAMDEHNPYCTVHFLYCTLLHWTLSTWRSL